MAKTNRHPAHACTASPGSTTRKAIAALVGTNGPDGKPMTEADATDYLWHALHSLDGGGLVDECDTEDSPICKYIRENS
jgi:hypothetical protein